MYGYEKYRANYNETERESAFNRIRVIKNRLVKKTGLEIRSIYSKTEYISRLKNGYALKTVINFK